jgi:hypothetical protein
MTAEKVLCGEELVAGEKAVAAGILLTNPALGNPHAVRCDWCHESRTLFRDESDAPFKLTAHGWRCEACEMNAASQEIKF